MMKHQLKKVVAIVALLLMGSLNFAFIPRCGPNGTYNIPNPNNCYSFYTCEWGVGYLRYCPDGLHYNSQLDVCDWPQSAGCSTDNEGDNSGAFSTVTQKWSLSDTYGYSFYEGTAVVFHPRPATNIGTAAVATLQNAVSLLLTKQTDNSSVSAGGQPNHYNVIFNAHFSTPYFQLLGTDVLAAKVLAVN